MNASDSIPIDPPLVSSEVLWWLRMTLVGIVSQSVALFGVISNVINIVIYIKLGLNDPMNVSLLGLSFSDFGGCLTIMWSNLCWFPPFTELELPFMQYAVSYTYGSLSHVAFTRVTTLITAFITMERSLCVMFPLKIKDIITTKRAVAVTVFFYLLTVALISPTYYVSYNDWVFFESRNRTIYTLLYREERDRVELIVYWIYGIFIPFCAFSSTVVWTVLLVYNLKKNAKWRQEATGATKRPDSSAGKSQVSSREHKVARMVVMISSLYIISNSPNLISTLVMFAIPEMKAGGTQVNLLHIVFYFNFLLDTANGALNIFIYYSMSSNYKAMFRKIFKLKENDKK